MNCPIWSQNPLEGSWIGWRLTWQRLHAPPENVESYNFFKKFSCRLLNHTQKWFWILHLASPLFPAKTLEVLQLACCTSRINPKQLARKKTPSVRTLQQIRHTNYTKITNTKYKIQIIRNKNLCKKTPSVRILQQIHHTFNPAADKSKSSDNFVKQAMWGLTTHHFE